MKNYTGSFTIYKGKGAAQFSLIRPTRDEKGRVTRNGAVFLEAAPSNGKQSWDWEQKITFAIGLPDICTIMDNPDSPKKLYHEKDGHVKTIEFLPGSDNWKGTFLLNLYEKDGDISKKVSVPVSGGEYAVLLRMMLSVAPLMVGWEPEY